MNFPVDPIVFEDPTLMKSNVPNGLLPPPTAIEIL
jgi:hypothetical protein